MDLQDKAESFRKWATNHGFDAEYGLGGIEEFDSTLIKTFQAIVDECGRINPQSIDCPKPTCRAKVGHFCDYIYGACHDERWRKVIRGW